jgi:hypothetical protein
MYAARPSMLILQAEIPQAGFQYFHAHAEQSLVLE